MHSLAPVQRALTLLQDLLVLRARLAAAANATAGAGHHLRDSAGQGQGQAARAWRGRRLSRQQMREREHLDWMCAAPWLWCRTSCRGGHAADVHAGKRRRRCSDCAHAMCRTSVFPPLSRLAPQLHCQGCFSASCRALALWTPQTDDIIPCPYHFCPAGHPHLDEVVLLLPLLHCLEQLLGVACKGAGRSAGGWLTAVCQAAQRRLSCSR